MKTKPKEKTIKIKVNTPLKFKNNTYSLGYNTKDNSLTEDLSKIDSKNIIFENLPWRLIWYYFRPFINREIKSKRTSKIIKITEKTNTLSINTKARKIEPPKPNTNKQTARMHDKMKKTQYATHKLLLKEAAVRKKRTGKPVKNKILARLNFLEKLGIKTTRSRIDSKVKEQHLVDLKKRRIDKQVVKPKIEKETKISDYKLKKQAKIKTAYEERASKLNTYCQNKKENGTNPKTKK